MYKISLDSSAKKSLRKLDSYSQKKIINKLKKLRENQEMGKPLIGNLSGLWRLRIGKYRVIYQIKKFELLILVLDIGHRKTIYR